MAKEIINVGQAANDGTGDPLRNAFEKVNSNFTELYDTADTQDLDFTGDSGTGAVELDSQTLNLVGTNGVETTANGQTITIDTSSLDTRLTTAEADIDTNTASITTEETARIAADTTLQTNIDTEATTRGSADTTLQTNIDSEAATRLANDNTLQSNIDAEAATRLANDNTLQGNIDTEASTRSSADTALQGQIDSNDTDIATNAANIATNTANISSNDTDISGLDSRLTTAEGNITSNDTDIATNVTNIATNVTNIATNATDIATNVTNIASNDTDISNLQSGKQNISEKNQANGYAPLDSGAKIPIANLPDSVVGQVEYQGTWDASIDDPTLPSASTVKGHYYVVSVGGTYETITYAIGDWIISNGVAWEKIDNTDAVTTVFGRLGAIVANEGDYSSYYPLIADLTAAETDIATNATNISSNDTDITALQNDKYDKTGGTISGNATITGNLIVDTNTLYVNSTNNRVGIGTTNPTRQFTVNGTSSSVININSNASDGLSILAFGDSDDDNYAQILFDNSQNKLQIQNGSGGVISNRGITIDNSENVGIGTDSPSSTLEISKNDQTNGAVLSITNSFEGSSWGEGDTIGSIDFKITDGSTAQKVRGQIKVFDDATSSGTFPAYNAMSFSTANLGVLSERMRITSGGDISFRDTSTNEAFYWDASASSLGIGTTSPSAKLHVSTGNDSNSGNIEFVIGGTAGNNARSGRIIKNTSTPYEMTIRASDFATGHNLILNDTGGNVGIGVNDPEAIFQVGDTTASVGTVSKVAIGIGDVDTGFYRPAFNTLGFVTTGTERMRIHSGGDISFRDTSANEAFYWDASTARLGIGTDSPTESLQIYNTSNAYLNITGGANSDAGIQLYADRTWAIQNDGNASLGTADYFHIYDGTAGASRLVIDTSGNVGIGTNSPALNASFDRVLHIHSPLGSLVKLTDNSTGSGILNGTDLLQYGFDFYIVNREDGYVRIDTNNTERMRITSAGNVGIKGTGTKLGWERASDNSPNIVYLTKNEDLGVNGNAKLHGYDGIIFSTEGSETPKMTINSNGNVGIGSDSPSAKLEIEDTTARTGTTASLIIEGRQDGAANVLTLRSKDFSAPTVGIGANHGPIMRWQGFDGTDFENMGYIFVGADGQTVANGDAPSYMSFGTSGDGSSSPAERMRITSGGFLKASNEAVYANIGATFHEMINGVAGSVALWMGHTSSTPYGLRINFSGGAPNNTTNYFINASDTSGTKFQVYSNGNVVNTNNSYGAISDIKLKENIVDATPKLDDLMQVKIRNYNLIGEETKQLGVVAQELEEVFPALVSESPDFEEQEVPQLDENGQDVLDENGDVVMTTEKVDLGTTTKSVKYSVFVPMLIKAVQELKAEIETLKSQINN